MPTLVDNPPEGSDWIHEIKFDGYRTQIVIEGKVVRIFTRRGFDWTAKYPAIAQEAASLDLKRAVIDGEIVIADAKGKPRFGDLRSAITNRSDELIFVGFDLLHLNGKDLRSRGVEERRAALVDILAHDGRIQFSGALEGQASDIFKAIEKAGLEGIVSKRVGSPYRSGPSTSWLKAKCYDIGHFDIVGVQREAGKPAIALMADKGKYVGGAFIVLNREMRERLWERVKAKTGAKPPAGMKADKAEWLKPGLVGRVKFLRGEEKLRHATLQDVEEQD